MSSERVIGTETEYGVYRPGDAWANPIALSTTVVTTYGEISRMGTPAQGAGVVRWDYTGEDPLNDLRGMRMSRAAVDPSLLTDDPYHLAPSGGSERVARPTAEELALPAATTAVLTNGARLYVDHAHPEYSSPEVLTPHDAVVWDRAGELVARRAMIALAEGAGAASLAGLMADPTRQGPCAIVCTGGNADDHELAGISTGISTGSVVGTDATLNC